MGFPVRGVVEMEGGAVARQVASRKWTHHQQPARAGCKAVARIQLSFRDGKWRPSAPDSQQMVGSRMAASCVPPPRSRPEQAAGWRPVHCSVQCRGRPRPRDSCVPPPRSRPEPAAGWRPVKCRGRSRQQASCAPPIWNLGSYHISHNCDITCDIKLHHVI